MSEPVVLVTGANGQLGRELQDLAGDYPGFHFIFLSKEDLPIHVFDKVEAYFSTIKPQYCINCAAYTAVDKAEADRETAMLVNGESPGVIAAVCKLHDTRFIHISTDYVFDGTASIPYNEEFLTSPVNYYGSTKLKGEELSLQNNSNSIVIRTSWVYSSHGNNFVKTMMRLMKERESLSVVNDQFGSPTYAADLAKIILVIIEQADAGAGKWVPGIYHFSNEGIISWYEFAVAIKAITGSHCVINPIPTASYPTPAKRPAYSAFNKSKIQATYRLVMEDWQQSLSAAMIHLKKL